MGIANAAFAELSGLAGNTGSKTAFTYLANGSGSTAFAAAQTALVSENDNTYGFGRASATVAQATTTQTNDTQTDQDMDSHRERHGSGVGNLQRIVYRDDVGSDGSCGGQKYFERGNIRPDL